MHFSARLIVFQFGISIMLIISTGIVFNQIDFARNKQLGFEKQHVVNIQLTDPTPRSLYRTYRQIISQQPSILSVSAASSAPAGVVNEGQMQPVGAPADEEADPKNTHGRTVSSQIADGVNGPPVKAMVADHQDEHNQCSAQGKGGYP